MSVDPLQARRTPALRRGHRARRSGIAAPNDPMIADPELKIAELYGMLAADAGDIAEGRTPADNQTVRNVFVIGPDKKIKQVLVYPMTTGATSTRRSGHRLAAADRRAQGGDAGATGSRART